MKPKCHIAIVTGSRAEFGLLQTVAHAINQHPRLRLSLIATGLHLTQRTWRDITDTGFEITAKVPMQKNSATGHAADVQAVARGIAGLGKTFQQLNPDIVMLLGDRIEAFAAATAASIGGYRLAHIHGGDRAEGIADEAMRHAISKLSHLHFAATAQSQRRLIRMGENPAHVYNVGSPAIDELEKIKPATSVPDMIILQHPTGQSDAQEYRWMKATLAATKKYNRMVLAPNSDPGSDGIYQSLAESKVDFITHLPRDEWLSILAGTKVIVGNSSAGLIEAAALKTGCVNIGSRQNGREKPRNVIDCNNTQSQIASAIKEALQLNLAKIKHPYGNGKTGQRIALILATLNMGTVPIRKQNAY